MSTDYKLSKELDPGSFKALYKLNEQVFFKSDYKSLSQHNGLRPGALHCVLGTTGSGKTSLVRSWALEHALKSRVMWFSTEESMDDFQTSLAYTIEKSTEKDPDWEKACANFYFVNALEGWSRLKEVKKFFNLMKNAAIERKAEIIVFDNVTTLPPYDDIRLAPEIAELFSKFAEHLNVPIICVAHTAKSVKDNTLFQSSSIRGSNQLAQRSQYLYALYRFHNATEHGHTVPMAFLHTQKHRSHPVDRPLVRLWYRPDLRRYVGDDFLDWDDFQNKIRRRKTDVPG